MHFALQVDNLSPKSTTLPSVANQIVNFLKSPDIIFLQEIQDNNGETDQPDGIVDASLTLSTLLNSISASGGRAKYNFTEVISQDGQDGGAPTGNIRPAYL